MIFNSSYRLLAVCVLVTVVAKIAAQDFNLEENIKELIARRKSVELMKQIVNDVGNELARLHKRTCNYNAGMGHTCDYVEMNKDRNDEGVWTYGPGKRKRSPDDKSKDGIRTLLKSMKALAVNQNLR